jgi:two-component system response regulator FixJ
MSNEQTVYIVDDDASVRKSLKFLLESVGLRVQVHDSAELFLREATTSTCGVLVTDVRMPGMSGLELMERLHTNGLKIPTIIVTGHADVPMAVRALRAGAREFVEKPYNDQGMLEMIQSALAHDRAMHGERRKRVETMSRVNRLTPREREVFFLVVHGKANKQIASELKLSEKTVEIHRANVMRKMDADSLAQLVRQAVIAESIDPSLANMAVGQHTDGEEASVE